MWSILVSHDTNIWYLFPIKTCNHFNKIDSYQHAIILTKLITTTCNHFDKIDGYQHALVGEEMCPSQNYAAYICVVQLGQHWSRWLLVASLAPYHYHRTMMTFHQSHRQGPTWMTNMDERVLNYIVCNFAAVSSSGHKAVLNSLDSAKSWLISSEVMPGIMP